MHKLKLAALAAANGKPPKETRAQAWLEAQTAKFEPLLAWLKENGGKEAGKEKGGKGQGLLYSIEYHCGLCQNPQCPHIHAYVRVVAGYEDYPPTNLHPSMSREERIDALLGSPTSFFQKKTF